MAEVDIDQGSGEAEPAAARKTSSYTGLCIGGPLDGQRHTEKRDAIFHEQGYSYGFLPMGIWVDPSWQMTRLIKELIRTSYFVDV